MPPDRHLARASSRPGCDCCRVCRWSPCCRSGCPADPVPAVVSAALGWCLGPGNRSLPRCATGRQPGRCAAPLRTRLRRGATGRNYPARWRAPQQEGVSWRTGWSCNVRPVSGPDRLAHCGRLVASPAPAQARCPCSARPHWPPDRPGPTPSVSRSRCIQVVSALGLPASRNYTHIAEYSRHPASRICVAEARRLSVLPGVWRYRGWVAAAAGKQSGQGPGDNPACGAGRGG